MKTFSPLVVATTLHAIKLIITKASDVLSTSVVICFLLFLSTSFVLAQDTWTQKANFSGKARQRAFSFSIGSHGYIGGGENSNSSLSDFWQYDPVNDTWTQKADFVEGVRSVAAAFSISNKGYVGTGTNGTIHSSSTFWEYNASTNAWTQKADFAGGGRIWAVGFSIGNKGYIGTGADDGGTWRNDFWEYDPATDTWTQKTDVGGGARAQAVGFSIVDKGYIGTGNDAGFNFKKDFWEYDPTTNTWTQKADYGGTPTSSAVGFCIGSKGYIGTGHILKTEFWEYDPFMNTWTRKADFGGAGRSGAIGFSVGGKGYIGTGSSYPNFYKDFWEYSPVCSGFTVYADGDGDDYGNSSNSLFVADCILPGGYVFDNSDCNDTNASINPGATEVANGMDDNCNGIIDEVISCPLPTNLSVVNITSTTAKFKWDAVAGAEGYKVRYKVANTSEWKIGTTYHNNKPISGLLPNTIYKWEVQTFCQIAPNVISEWSSIQEFTTGSVRMGDEQEISIELYPNPVQANLTLDLQPNSSANQSVDIFLLNALGQIIYSSREEVVNGELKKEITMPSTASQGWYIVRVVMNDQVIEKKLLYQK